MAYQALLFLTKDCYSFQSFGYPFSNILILSINSILLFIPKQIGKLKDKTVQWEPIYKFIISLTKTTRYDGFL